MALIRFETLYEQLNPEQQEAVDTIEGPVMVIAGPGTGKTQVLTLRIANILRKTQVNPGNILALTFTESGAGEMRERLARIMGPPAYSLTIFTFHGFCNDLIRSYPDAFSELVSRKPADEMTQIRAAEEAFSGADLSLLRPFGDPLFYLQDARRAISDLKREGVTPEAFRRLVEEEERRFAAIPDLRYEEGRYQRRMRGKYVDLEKQIRKNAELALVYETYEKGLRDAGVYDYDDMILEVLAALERNSDFLLRLQERFQYFLVDEHQDTNSAQNRVLELLGNFFENPNLFVVGDEKQAIFRFQGASLENFLHFKRLYPGAKLIVLKRNYRSPQGILDFASDFIRKNSRNISAILPEVRETLVSDEPKRGGRVTTFAFSHPEVELYFVAKKIRELLAADVPAGEIAVLYRDNHDAFPLAEMLEKQGIPFRVESRRNIIEDPDVQKLITLLRFLDDIGSEEKLARILHIDFLGISSLDIYKLLSGRGRRPLLRVCSDVGALDRLDIEGKSLIAETSAKLLHWHRLLQNRSFGEALETILRESGLIAAIVKEPDSAVRLHRLTSLFREIKHLDRNHPGFSLKDFLQYLDLVAERGSSLKEQVSSFVPKAVRLMTAHGAKGREFDFVFLINASDGHWGNRRSRELIRLPAACLPMPDGRQAAGKALVSDVSTHERNDDERRLFYVAVTRARKEVFVSYALRNEEERQQLPSQFLEEVLPALRGVGESDQYERLFEKEKSMLFGERVKTSWSVFEADYVRHLFLKRGMSATALNNFLACPWRYFYVNLLRIPKVPNRHQRYGRAIHIALKDFFDALRIGKSAPEFLLARFEEALRDEGLRDEDYAVMLKRGRGVLSAYVEQYRGSWNTNTQNEFRVEQVFLSLPAFDEPLRLTGSIDKIEFEHEEVNVMDYKTGRPRSRNELEGRTKHATGDYKRQLVFYKLILDAYPPFPYDVRTGEIDFVEPDPSGRFHRERFVISNEEVEELRGVVGRAAERILSLSFWDDRCGDRECEFCALQEMR